MKQSCDAVCLGKIIFNVCASSALELYFGMHMRAKDEDMLQQKYTTHQWSSRQAPCSSRPSHLIWRRGSQRERPEPASEISQLSRNDFESMPAKNSPDYMYARKAWHRKDRWTSRTTGFSRKFLKYRFFRKRDSLNICEGTAIATWHLL